MKTAVITGGTGAIGKALISEFAHDYRVVFTYLNNEVNAAWLSQEYGAEYIKCDVSSPDDISKLEQYMQNCSLLINNAGISQIKLFTDITDKDWQNMIDINLSGVFYTCRLAAKHMIRRKEGCIINISSVWGIHGASCEVHYSAAKAGVIGLTKALSKELGPSGIRVNCIAPGVIDSPMNGHLNADELLSLTNETPLGRIGMPSEIAHAVRFFAENMFATGQILGVDGGFAQ